MKRRMIWIVGMGAGLLAAAPVEPQKGDAHVNTPRVKTPAVAGLFYPAEREVLQETLGRFLQEAKRWPLGKVRALVCPHAGYTYSGQTAAWGYRQVEGDDFQTVILMAPSHYALFEGASVSNMDFYETPLGRIRVSDKARQLARRPPFTDHPRAQVQRPGWALQSPFKLLPGMIETPHTWEHAEEVHLPFIQTVLPSAEIVPVIFGQVNARQAADALAGVWDGKTLLVASSDLSHYHPDARARALDKACVQTVLDLDAEKMETQEACGRGPITALIHLARAKGWRAKLLDARNSGDISGDRNAVVGYAAIVFFDETESADDRTSFGAREQKQLLNLARKTIVEAVTHGTVPSVRAEDFSPSLRETKGCFVTLSREGRLRGCIGHLVAHAPLYLDVMDNARGAALHDGRFEPVRAEELAQIHIEISVLTSLQPLVFKSPEELLARLHPGVDGVVLKIGDRRATYLPQVWEKLPGKEVFLDSLAQKAGCAPAAWRSPNGVEVSTYQVVAFHEPERE